MKKVYNTPELNMICVQIADILTMSAGEGTMPTYSFNDIIGGNADGWSES